MISKNPSQKATKPKNNKNFVCRVSRLTDSLPSHSRHWTPWLEQVMRTQSVLGFWSRDWMGDGWMGEIPGDGGDSSGGCEIFLEDHNNSRTENKSWITDVVKNLEIKRCLKKISSRYNWCLTAATKCRLLMTNTHDMQRQSQRQQVMSAFMAGKDKVR